ncbi:MAG: dienelactone hydrolase family protein [Candidatus Binataceae bacterium]|nr:dienelactone hydrolase family protein [Candidatus Binataceae bacterium]
MNEQRITFPSGALTLEGLIARPDSLKSVRGGVVCHPHPLYGGSMYNNVVDAILDAMWRQGWATLRFNFRGVGESEGEHDGGAGEAADAAAALEFLQAQPGVLSTGAVLAGYSFGSVAAMTAASAKAAPGALVLVALPLKMVDARALQHFAGPIVLAAGDQDMYCPAPQLEALHQDLGARAQRAIVPGADHFFGGCEPELADALAAMFKSI